MAQSDCCSFPVLKAQNQLAHKGESLIKTLYTFPILFSWAFSEHDPYIYVIVGFRLCNVNCMRLPCIPNYPIDYFIVLRWNHNTVQLKIQLLWENVCFVNIQLKTQSNFVILQLPTSFRSSFVWASKCWDRIGRVRRYSFFIPWFIDFISAMLYLSYLSFIIWLLWNISLFILWFIDFIYQRCHICLSSSD